ncbi:hypothetical protein FGO68_gene9923 [Halteria grandinella]|uniref:Uncharacterized protein n=1 Tax=Halteria grandinella TaxID=5974 RepID=A0A8J8NU23_HALGN|nr:hypothetical protein FGO68_gene9923 [Halteria grandinella]
MVSRLCSILNCCFFIPRLQRLLRESNTSSAATGVRATFLLISLTSLSNIMRMSFSFERKTSRTLYSCFNFKAA